MRLLKNIFEYLNFFTGSRHLCRKINDPIEINHKRIRQVMDMKNRCCSPKILLHIEFEVTFVAKAFGCVKMSWSKITNGVSISNDVIIKKELTNPEMR